MKLTIDSICLISAILDKVKLDDDFINEMFLMGKEAKGKSDNEIKMTQNKIGMKVIMKLGSQLHNVRDELIKFIANYKEITEEEAEKVNIIEVLKELANDEGFTSFLKRMTVQEKKK